MGSVRPPAPQKSSARHSLTLGQTRLKKMDAIKKKMQSLKTETENAMARADQLDAEFRAATTLAEKTEETVRDLQKKMQHVENELDITLEKLTQTTTKFDEKEKAYAVAEGEIQAQRRGNTKAVARMLSRHL